jgi:Phytanoyl-CoA dioxygenase (PhyH)
MIERMTLFNVRMMPTYAGPSKSVRSFTAALLFLGNNAFWDTEGVTAFVVIPTSAESTATFRRRTFSHTHVHVSSEQQPQPHSHQEALPDAAEPPPLPLSSSPVYGLYEIQEEMLIRRGIYEEGLMQCAESAPLTAVPLKGSRSSTSGRSKGFGNSSSSSNRGAKQSPSKFAAEAVHHATLLRREGVVRVDNVLSAAVADRLRDFVFDLRRDSLHQVQAGTLSHSDRFADVLLRANRCDLKLPLGNAKHANSSNGWETDTATTTGAAAAGAQFSNATPVIEALHGILCESAVKDTIAAGLSSDQAVLYELSCLISDPGSQRQVVHPDNPYVIGRTEPTLLTCFVALQDVSLTMGPTVFLPRTHTALQHAAFADEAKPVSSALSELSESLDSPKDALLRHTKSVVSTLTKGSCAIFDSRLLHCGSANRSAQSRAIFYFSFRNPTVAYPGNPASIRADLGAAQLGLQDLTDTVFDIHNKGARNPFAF